LEKSIKIAEELKDVPSLVMGITWLAIAHAFCCDFRRARFYFERSLEIRGLQNWGVAHGKSGLSIFVYNWQGEIDRAYETSREAHRIAEIEGDMFSKSNANFGLGCSSYHKGLIDDAESLLWSACHFFEMEHIVSWWAFAYLYLGLIKFDMLDYESSIKFHNLSLSLFQSAKIFPSFHNFNKLAILRAKVFQNQEDTDLSNLIKYEENNQFKIYEGWIPHLIAEILLKQDDFKFFEAEDWIRKAMDANQKNGMKWLLARDFMVYAEIFRRKNEQKKAKENFKKAIETFKECGADGWVEKYENGMLSLT
jgi:tetratricopeptide (TPR) repeat protein